MDARSIEYGTVIDLNRFLQKHNLTTLMPVRADDQSGWMVPFQHEALAICKRVEAHFIFLEDSRMQARAIQDDKDGDVVVMYAGMFWLLCRLAAAIAGSGVFPAMEGENEPTWTPDPVKSLQAPRDLLNEGTAFNWELESAGWKSSPDRQMLFYAVLSVLFRFVMFHEIGHLQNDHGRRRAAVASSPMVIDAVNPSLLEPKDAIPSQAREIVADSFALKMTLEILDRELSLKGDLEMAKILKNKLMPNQEALVGFVLTVIYLYFRLLDRSNWQEVPIDHLSHPPAPFRMKALMAALVEHKHLNISNEAAERSVQAATVAGDAVMSVILEIYPNPHWFQIISTLEHDRHFERLFQEIPHWSGRLPRSINPQPTQV